MRFTEGFAGCNIHEFVAESPCAVLDLLTPRYDPKRGMLIYTEQGRDIQRATKTWVVRRAAE